MAKTVVGLFDDFHEAQSVVQDLVNAGIPREDISIAANQNSSGYAGADTGTTGSETGSGAAKGAGTGAVIGGLGGLLVGLGALAIPGVGPIIAAGPLAATLTGAGVGAATGGLIGALTNAGVPREEAEYYNEGVRRGGTLVTASVPDDLAGEAVDIMNRHGALDIDRRGETFRQGGYTGYNPDAAPFTTEDITRERDKYRSAPSTAGTAETVIPVVEEELQVGKRQVQRGGARIHTYVTETPVTESINLHEEHVTVDRRPVVRPVTEADRAAFQEGSFEVTETSEVPVVAKTAHVIEEVVVGKTTTDRVETVSDTVRRTDVEVERLDNLRSSDVNSLDEDTTLDTDRTRDGSRSNI